MGLADDQAVDAYKLRREADLLRRRLYGEIGSADGADRKELLERLAAIERRLPVPAPAGKGEEAGEAPSVGAKSGSSFTLGTAAAKIRAVAQLRMERVPT